MSSVREFSAWDNSDRREYFDDYGNLTATQVDRTTWSGEYKCTDVYNEYNQKIGSFVRKE